MTKRLQEMSSQEMMDSVDACGPEVVEFINTMLNKYDPLILASLLVSTGLVLYERHLTPEQYKKIIQDVISEDPLDAVPLTGTIH